ncbi:hypothetical protein DTO006G1_8788 [Penicillium roqueforti]|nr:hypothetical protein DTO006G1_8788 [Penicillium roqueforti]KAI3249938.1 hypothetical protein DTO006G7_8992 [Penicillium roqueforti]
MVHGGMDGYDWLQHFLPADTQTGHDPSSDIEAHETHPAFHDAEEVAKAAVMHQQAQKTYMLMRSTYPNHASNPSQAYSQASGEQYGGNKHQRNSNIQSNNAPYGPSEYQTARSRNITQRPNPSALSQKDSDALARQDAYRRAQIPVGPPQRSSNSRAVSTSRSPYQGYSATPNQNFQISMQRYMTQGMAAQVQRTSASQSPSYTHSTIPPHNTQRSPYSTTDIPPVQRTHTPVARSQSHKRPYQSYSTTPAQDTQQVYISAAAQRTHVPVTRPRESQSPYESPYESHSTIPQNAQGSPHQNAPRSSYSMGAEIDTALDSPKGLKPSAARSTIESRHSITPAMSTREGPSTNSARSNPISPLPSFRNQDHVQSAVPIAPDRVRSPATFQPVSTRSPSLSFVSSAPAPAPPAPPTQTSNQTNQKPPISRQNVQSTPVVSSASVSFTPPVASHTGHNSSHTSGPRRGTISDSAVAQQPTAGNAQSRGHPLPIPPPHQQKRWVPSQDHFHGSMPPAKMRRLDNGGSQTMPPRNDPSAGSSVPGARVPMVQARPRGLDKNRDYVVQPIRQSDLLRKQSYNPATIARDILISAGKHPTEKPLNHHLEALRLHLTKADIIADLATIRWDLVDVKPQVGRMPPVSAPQMPSLPPPHSRPLPTDSRPLPTHSRPLPTDSRPLPTHSRPLPTHSRPLPHPQPPQMPPLRPPHPQSLQADQQLLPRATPNHAIARDHASLPSRDTPPNRQVATPESIDARASGGFNPWGTLSFQAPTNHSSHKFSSNFPSGLPRIDPVPASPNFSSRKSVPFPTPPSPQPQPQPPPQQRPPSTTKSAAPPKSPPARKQATPQSITQPTPQGQTVKSQSDSNRTVKSPEARCLSQPQVVIPLSPKMAPKRRPGRPPRSVANNVEVAIPREQPVHYQIFPCKWEGCIAELHNLDSVRAHIVKVHIPHSLVCKWEDCDNKTPMAAADMFRHLSSEHISKMAWALGDGPKVPVTAEIQSNHPSVMGDRSARKGTMILPVEQIAVEAFSKVHGKSTIKTKAQALLEAGRHWKQQIGPDMDWSDRRLSTPARQNNVHCGEMAFVAND